MIEKDTVGQNRDRVTNDRRIVEPLQGSGSFRSGQLTVLPFHEIEQLSIDLDGHAGGKSVAEKVVVPDNLHGEKRGKRRALARSDGLLVFVIDEKAIRPLCHQEDGGGKCRGSRAHKGRQHSQQENGPAETPGLTRSVSPRAVTACCGPHFFASSHFLIVESCEATP